MRSRENTSKLINSKSSVVAPSTRRSIVGLFGVLALASLGACAGHDDVGESAGAPASLGAGSGGEGEASGATEPSAAGSDPFAGERFVLVDGPEGGERLYYDWMDGSAVYEGDIFIDAPLDLIQGGHVQAAHLSAGTWSQGVVVYRIDDDLPEPERVTEAMRHWESKTAIRFVERTTESAYLDFRSSVGCSSFVGRTGRAQRVSLATGESSSNVVDVAVNPRTGDVTFFYKRGFATRGDGTNAAKQSAHFKYELPKGIDPEDIVGVDMDDTGRVYAWYADGTFSIGTERNLESEAAPAPYALPSGRSASDIRGISLGDSGEAIAYYRDGTLSAGTPADLGSTSAAQAYTLPSGYSGWRVVGVGRGKRDESQFFFSDNSSASGQVATVSGQVNRVRYTGHCSTGSTIHEIGHAVGLHHEQTRRDRDQYIEVFVNNIISGKESNFAVHGTWRNSDSGPYDFDSIMHYSSYAFSKNGQPTIRKRSGGLISAQRQSLSVGDIEGVESMYGKTPALPSSSPSP